MGKSEHQSLPLEVSVKEILFPPYLFFLVIDVLSKLLNKAISNGRISGIKLKPSCPTLSHLFFADDVVLFLNANKVECSHIFGYSESL